MNNGKVWVVGLLALGVAAGTVAVSYWQSPENSVRWSFTQIHTSLVRGKKDAAARFLQPSITFNGKQVSAGEFLASYSLDRQTDEIDTRPCPSTPSHMTVTMAKQGYCFIREGRLWKLHQVGAAPCPCR